MSAQSPRTRYSHVQTDRERSERNRELKILRTKTEPGLERADSAATLAVWFHRDRAINEVMELLEMVWHDSDRPIEVLLGAYLADVDGDEDTMERLAMLCNAGRWSEKPDLVEAVKHRVVVAATAWVQEVDDEIDQAERLSTVERRFDDDVVQRVVEQMTQDSE